MTSNFYDDYFGINESIEVIEIIVRSILMFLITFVMIRVAGMRQFRQNSPFDMVIAFLVGGVLSRGVVGATPFFSAVAGALGLIILQKLLYMLLFHNRKLEKMMKGQPFIIYKDGKFIKENMKKADITTLEVFEDLRVEQQTQSLQEIAEIYVEKTGEISFIKKDKM
jgi:uncharacterized membrane protein YcaP (DUF421 family)